MTEFLFPTSLTTGQGVGSVTAFREGHAQPIYQASENHPYWDGILHGLRKGDPNVWDLFDVKKGVVSRFKQVTERVSFDGDNVLWDGDPVHSTLAEQFQRAVQSGNGADYTALAKFWEKLETNPSKHSREQAYDWLAAHKFQITEDGDVVGYKYVYNTEIEGLYQSGHSSQKPDVPSAFVNGNPIKPLSTVPQKVGDVVTLPRSEVCHDPNLACERGLHVGTFNYVGGGGTRPVLEVHVNPRDIVSVPTHARGGKVRVCRYYAARLTTEQEPGTEVVKREGNSWAGDVGTKV